MKKITGLGFFLLFFVSNVSALDLGVGAKAGINGIGLDLTVGLTRTLNLRFAAANIDIDDESETVTVGDAGAEGDINADLTFDFGSNAVFLDWHAFDGSFRFTAGMFKHTGAVDLSGTLQSNIVVNGQPLATDDLGRIGGEVSLSDSFKPYLGIGWGRGAGGEGGFSFSADLGVAVLDPAVDLTASVNTGGSNGLNQAELDQRLSELEKDAEQDLEDLELWPVLAFGVNYAF